MKQQRISSYFISLSVFLLLCIPVQAQNDSIISTVNDSLKIKLKYGLRVGGDIGKLIRSFSDDEYTGFEINADYRIKKALYIAGELGIEEKITTNDYLDVTTSGSYLKAGIDYNLYKNWLDMDNMVYSGFRVGASAFSQQINNFTVYNTSQYWGEQYSSTEAQKFNDLTAFWIELIIGIKVELFNNLYLGLNAQLKGLVSETVPDNFENIYIPGFNKTYDSSGIGVGYGYSISYLIPLYKKNKN
ncbi:DUF6048 family protein [Gaetbulibacter sp. M235]|uniref:DUF6048 family protein n=1 Tax=Gaetbulibacter sp. M235 TaxID=3126510 RepID=UPI00374EDC0F